MKKKAFTLIELLIVCAIIGLITALILTYLSGARKKGRDSQRIADIKQIESGLEVYFSNCNTYPANLTGLTSDCNSNKILNAVPVDPLKTQYPYYFGISPSYKYHVCATLELGYSGGIGKSGQASSTSGISGDQCNGALSSTYDRFGPQ